MNPFLEGGWSDTNTLLIAYVRDELAKGGLPPGLRARAEEHLAIEEFGAAKRSVRADVAVADAWKRGVAPAWSPSFGNAQPVALASPELVAREPDVERRVEITAVDGTLVTVIEVLSPGNKTGPGRDRYLKKRAACVEAGVNVVEIDLLRGGGPTVAAEVVPHPGGTRYTICVFRAAEPDRFEVYHWGLRDHIPAFAVPLRVEDPDAALDLQPLLDRAYELGYYWQDRPEPDRLAPPARLRGARLRRRKAAGGRAAGRGGGLSPEVPALASSGAGLRHLSGGSAAASPSPQRALTRAAL